MRDLLEKARITDERLIYSIEILDSKLDYLPQFISSSTNLYELNHLAKRLASLSQWELDCFEGMVMMDAIQTEYAPITVERLINMTHSMSDCQVVYEAHDDRTLGKFYADNDFVPKLEGVPDEVYSCLDFEKIGKEMREGEGGVFTPHGYVLQNGEIAKTYQSGDAIPLENPDYTILLSIGKGYFNDPEYDNDLTVQLKLPADDAVVSQAVETVGAASLRECTFYVEDCLAPSLAELITDELNECDGGITVVDALAELLHKLDREGRLPVYKAMLEAGPKDLTLDEAADLAEQAVDVQLLREIVSPLEYARAELAKHDIPLKGVLLANRDLQHYGQKLMESHGASCTGYGILLTPEGMTMEQCLARPEPSRGMEMK
nr:antirestriction protein ArdA [Desulfitobacterium hafniense]